MKAFLSGICAGFLFLLAAAPAPAAGTYVDVTYPASTTKGELQMGVTYTLWLPEGVAKLRGVIVHQHGCGTGACKGGETAAHDLHWQALAKKWDCALLGPSYHQDEKQDCRLWCDPRNGSAKTFLQALTDLAAKSKHPELETVPWCLWGHSGGGFWASLMQTKYPERIVALWFRSGTAFATWEKGEIEKPEIPEAAYAIPMMCNPGGKEKDDKRFNGAWTGTYEMFKAYRAKGAPAGFAPDPRTSHECGDSRYLAIPFFDACLALRLPDKDAKDQKLKPVDSKAAWLAKPLGDEAEAAAKYTGKPEEAVWLPNERVAKAWVEYVKTGAVPDTTAPSAPFDVKVKRNADQSAEITWEADADFESGIQAFIIQRDGEALGQVPEKPVGRFGRPLFQSMSYHDTPEKPLPEMRFIDKTAKAGEKHTYRIIAVNSAGLKSEPSKEVALAVAPVARPNIVFILADDLGINDLSCYGRKDQPTPQIDKLAQQGMRFTTAYAQSVCSPTRATLLTGKASARLHITTFLPGRDDTPAQLLLHPKIEMQLPKGEKTLADLLKPAGYTSACLGKWHLGGKGFLPTDRGFDIYFPGHANTKPSETEGGKGEYELTEQAEKFIEDNKDKPFFLYLAHNNPHVPLGAKPELIEKNKDAFNPTYAAMMTTLDDSVGRVVAKLDALGLSERTILVFMSDNGGLHVPEGPNTPSTTNAPYRAGKGHMYEGGLRVPLIVRYPGKVKAGSTNDTPVTATDWTPTLLDLIGVEKPEKLDGVSLSGVLTRGATPAARPLFWHQPHYTNQGGLPAGAIRLGDWKLIEFYEDGHCELYDLAHDPGEATDLAAKEPARVAELRGKLEAWRREVSAQENTANAQFNGSLRKRLYIDVDSSKLEKEDTAAAMAKKLAPWRTLMNDVVPKLDKKTPGVEAGAGAVLLHARDAKVHGTKLHYEREPHKDTLGFWVQADDWAEWEFEVASAGTFEVELLQGCGKGSGGAEVEVAVDGQSLTFKVEETGHFQRFIPRSIGTVKLAKAGRYTLTVKAKSKPGGAVMDVRRVTLRSAP